MCSSALVPFRGDVLIGRYSWVPKVAPDEQAFEAIKAGIDSLPPGVKMVLNSCA